MESIEVEYVVAHAMPGSNVNDCVREAIQYALENECEVRLQHNSDRYDVSYREIINHIHNSAKPIPMEP